MMAAIISLDGGLQNVLSHEVIQNREGAELIWLDEDVDNSLDYSYIQSILLERQLLSFCLLDQKQTLGRNLSTESASFLWYQMLIYVLKQMPHDEQAKDDMMKVCYEYCRTNNVGLHNVERFRNDYSSDKVIDWYTRKCFVYKLLNKALRTENIEFLYLFWFFIIDLCAALEKESHYWKDDSLLTLYRGAQIPRKELEKLKQNEGEIISMNGFLSTSRDTDVSITFAGQSLPLDDVQAVLFQITADPSLTTIVFADIKNKAHIKDENEVLFHLNSTFKIGCITYNSMRKITIVELTATDARSEIVQEYFMIVK
ncbi:hypothetical protein I4U23_027300 [Adineta vaga]|nr:hypothetical protein I4U23_027300 [Adineta vaga]